MNLIHEHLKDALSIMDRDGRHNPEGNSTMLWDKDWERVRSLVYAGFQLTSAEPKETLLYRLAQRLFGRSA